MDPDPKDPDRRPPFREKGSDPEAQALSGDPVDIVRGIAISGGDRSRRAGSDQKQAADKAAMEQALNRRIGFPLETVVGACRPWPRSAESGDI